MNLQGIPNDLMQDFDPISILLFVPISNFLILPFIRNRGIHFHPTARISLSIMCVAIIQHLIYISPPCYSGPLRCPGAFDNNDIAHGNNINVATQSPAYVFIGISEIFAYQCV